jgi:hypothetical protein
MPRHFVLSRSSANRNFKVRRRSLKLNWQDRKAVGFPQGMRQSRCAQPTVNCPLLSAFRLVISLNPLKKLLSARLCIS